MVRPVWAAPRSSLLGFPQLKSPRAPVCSDRSSQRLPTSGRGFNRMAVQSALTHALNLWKSISPKQYPNGAVVFCSEDFAEILHPPTALKRRIYDCGRQFDTSVLEDAIDMQLGPTYGVIAVDGSDAAFGKVQGLCASLASGPVISELGCIGSHIAGRTRRGGQSALRYSRLREESELAFLRKVSERAAMLLTEVQGVILGGKADMKRKLLQELPETMRKQVMCIVDLSCNAGPEALRHAALRAAESVASSEHSEVERALANFFELTLGESMCCYGEAQSLKALEMGAVEQLLLVADVETRLGADGLRTLAASYGTHVVEICPRTEQGAKFCESFGVGGCLRWPLDLELVEEDAEAGQEVVRAETFGVEGELQDYAARANICDCKASDASNCTVPLHHPQATLSLDAFAEIELTSIRTTDTADLVDVSQHHKETLAWFEAELRGVMDDSSAAEAMMACVEVVLSDEVSSRDEIAESVVAVTSSEGVPEELALELVRRW